MKREEYIKHCCESAGWDLDSPEARDVADRYDEAEKEKCHKQIMKNIKRAMSRSIWASKDINEGLINLNCLSDESDNEGRLFSSVHYLEHARDCLTQAIAEINNKNLKVSNEVASLAGDFHTFLRKCCEGTSAIVLYRAIKNHTDQWDLLLANVTENIEDDDFDLSLENINVNQIVELAETFDDMFELKAAFEFFSLQNDEDSEMLWKDLFK